MNTHFPQAILWQCNMVFSLIFNVGIILSLPKMGWLIPVVGLVSSLISRRNYMTICPPSSPKPPHFYFIFYFSSGQLILTKMPSFSNNNDIGQRSRSYGQLRKRYDQNQPDKHFVETESQKQKGPVTSPCTSEMYMSCGTSICFVTLTYFSSGCW